MVEVEEFTYPKELKDLYTPDCIEYRSKFNDIMHRYGKRRLDTNPSEKERFEDIVSICNIIVPHDQVLNKLNNPFDIISTSVLKDGSASIFLGYPPPNNSNEENLGKTSIMLKLFGINVPYDEIPNTRKDVLNSGMRKISPTNGRMKLLTSDMSYIGVKNGLIEISQNIGEQLVAQWDLARHIFRVKDPNYWPGKHREPSSRPYLEALGEMYYLDSKIFADNEKSYPIDKIFAIRRRQNSENGVFVEEISPEKLLEELEGILMKNPHHISRFWKINKGEHVKRAGNVMENLHRVPKMYKVFMPPYVSKRKEEVKIEKVVETISHFI